MTRVPASALFYAVIMFAALLSLSCEREALKSDGALRIAVQVESPTINAVAAALPGLSVNQEADTLHWFRRFIADQERGTTADLYQTEWGLELESLISQGQLFNGKAYWERVSIRGSFPPWLNRLAIGPAKGFIPSTVYTWGLFVNGALASAYTVSPPATLRALETVFATIKSEGLTPIALGSSYGWPAAAWFTILDLRLNGAKIAAERYAGTRPFNDESAKNVFRKLADWRDKGWFSADANKSAMNDSLHAVETGQAFCVLMGAFAYERFSFDADIRFFPLPYGEGNSQRAEIVGLNGFFIPSGSSNAEAAYAFMEALLKAGGLEKASSTYKVPLIETSPKKNGVQEEAVSLNAFIRAQADMLAAAKAVILAFDRAMPNQAIQSSLPLWADFFSPNGIDGDAFADTLNTAMMMAR